MRYSEAIKYYSRPEVCAEIARLASGRETIAQYGLNNVGKRPDIIELPGDVKRLARLGATSFHTSEEIWDNPLSLSSEINPKQMNDLRKGWDLIIDIDSPTVEYGKITAELILKAFKFHDMENASLKFSVTGDTPILLKKNSEISLVSISKAINILKTGQKIEVLSLNSDNKLIFSEVYNSLEHDEEVYEIYHTQSKLPLRVTKYHSVFCLEDGEVVQKETSQLCKGDNLVTFNSKTDLPRHIPELINGFEYFGKPTEHRVIITKGLMRLIGYYLAEGHATKLINQVGFSFNTNELDYISDCTALLKEITGRTISNRHPNLNSHQILIHSKEWYSFFYNNCGIKKDKHVPSFVWSLPKDFFIELLKGYMRGDGHLGKYDLRAKSVSKQLTTGLVWLCNLNGISCTLYTEQNKSHTLPQGTFFKSSFAHVIRIPRSELHSDEFHRPRNKFSPYPDDKTLPTEGLLKVYKQSCPRAFNDHRSEQMTLSKKRANFLRIKKVIDWIEKYSTNKLNYDSSIILERYKKLLLSDIGIVSIKGIKKVNKKERVYDVSVKGSERFFGNYYPILLHNSGNKGFHIGIPFKALPKSMRGEDIKNLFPDAPRVIAKYLQEFIRPHLSEAIIEKIGDLNKIIKDTGKKKEDLIKNGKLDPYQIIELDTILIAPRHLFRMPYSLHEKSGLVSVVLKPEELKDFDKNNAKPELVKEVRNWFLNPDLVKEGEATQLVVQAFDWEKKVEKKEDAPHVEFEGEIEIDKFPPCIKNILAGLEDGKKRSLFVLLNFFKCVNWSMEKIEFQINEWNKKNKVPLKSSYIKAQINWHKVHTGKIPPPNCESSAYYKDIGVCKPIASCKGCKNPLTFVARKTKKGRA